MNRRPLPAALGKLRLPVIGSPLFIISNPKLVIAQCQAGIVGSMPSLNARVISVSIIPGATTFAVMPREPTSSASALVNPIRPAFEAA